MKQYVSVGTMIVLMAMLVGTVTLNQQPHDVRSRASTTEIPQFINTPIEGIQAEYATVSPQVEGVKITKGDNSVIISWETSRPMESEFDYGYKSDLTDYQFKQDEEYRMTHAVYFPYANPATHYFRIKASDNDHQDALSDIYNFGSQ